jgi:anthranilate phosphoribosyltransferase
VETAEESTGAVEAMRRRMTPLKTPQTPLLDTCGTGGDNSCAINVSTLAALVSAGAGVIVAKHGNRSVSSQCGSADLLETLGVKVDFSVGVAEKMLKEIGITFLFAPIYHPAMKNVAPVRKELGIRTLFNILGPLCNPAEVKHQLVGVFSPDWLKPMAEALEDFGAKHVLVVHGMDGVDEISMSGPTRVCELNQGKIFEYEISPEKLGFSSVPRSEIKGGSAKENGEIALRILKGEKGSCRNWVVFNSAAALYAADNVPTIEKGIRVAEETIDSGRALEKLKLLQKYSQSLT